MPGDAYITLLGRSVWALVNAYYAVLREKRLRPERVYIVTEDVYSGSASVAAEALRIISDGYGCAPEIVVQTVPEADFVGAGRKIRSLAGDVIGEGHHVAIDITSGRKVMVAGALLALSLARLDIRHIYYLAMRGVDDIAQPYMMIPLQNQRIHDVIEDAGVTPDV
jgi:hypothetical protein